MRICKRHIIPHRLRNSTVTDGVTVILPPQMVVQSRTFDVGQVGVKLKVVFLYSAVSSPLDRSKRFTLFASPGRPVLSDTNSASLATAPVAFPR